jgi:6-phosphogluconolactonase
MALHPPPHPPILFSFPDKEALTQSLADFVGKAQKESIDKKGKFTVALSGGSLPKLLGGLVSAPDIKWKNW